MAEDRTLSMMEYEDWRPKSEPLSAEILRYLLGQQNALPYVWTGAQNVYGLHFENLLGGIIGEIGAQPEPTTPD